MRKDRLKIYAGWVVFAEAVGGLSGWLTRNGVKVYNANVIQPPLAPPSIVFPVVWAILFALMGIGAARIYMSRSSKARMRALALFFVQLAFNFLWSIIFFNYQAFGLALAWIIVLLALIIAMIIAFLKVDRPAGYMQIPYAVWVAFATYLNYGVWKLNG
ncbi:MAG: tryptophan-rich sensory protein [Clostridiales bacterium]|nr:tryptophan-rich sensory protein [Clostridiales bacterium]